MPVQYEGVRQEHMAVREGCGIFDVSHMGEIETSGPESLELLQRLLSNDVARIALGANAGGAQYSVLCREDGGVLDDLFTYRLDVERYLTVTNAANHASDLQWFREHARWLSRGAGDRQDQRLRDAGRAGPARPGDRAGVLRLAAAGANDARACGGLAGPRCSSAAPDTPARTESSCCAPREEAPLLWDELVRRGARPAGLAARDTLRLEVCFHLYGNDLSVDRGPIEAGLGWCCREDTGFIGAEAVRAVRSAGPAEKLVAFAIEGPGIARQGNPVLGGGEVTSGTLSPCLGTGIGMAYVPAERAAPGTRLELDVRGKMRPAVVKEKPLYRKGS